MRSILLAVMNLGKAVLALRTPRLQSSGAVRHISALLFDHFALFDTVNLTNDMVEGKT